MKECNIEKVNEVLKSFLGAQIEFNDSVDADIDKLKEKLNLLDEQTADTLATFLARLMVLEKELSDVREDNNDMKTLFNKNKKVDNKVNQEINNIYHHLKQYRKWHNDSLEEINEKFYILNDKIHTVEKRLDVLIDYVHNERRRNNATNK